MKKFLALLISVALLLSTIVLPASAEGNTTELPEVGSYITFGSYEQDNDTSNGKESIEWQVLSVDETSNKVLVLSKYALDCKKYNQESEDITWESCTLRAWLNDDFCNSAFSDEEKAKISEINLVNADNPNYGTSGGNNTTDKIFLLSASDIINTAYGFDGSYNTSDTARVCQATE